MAGVNSECGECEKTRESQLKAQLLPPLCLPMRAYTAEAITKRKKFIQFSCPFCALRHICPAAEGRGAFDVFHS